MVDSIKGPEFKEAQAKPDIVLKPLSREDAEEYLRVVQANRTDLDAQSIYVPVDAEDVIGKIVFPMPQGRTDFIILAEGSIVGEIDIIPHGQRAELFYWIDQNQRGRGFAKEAVKQATEHAFSDPNVNSLRAWVQKDNTASQRTLKANGFVHEDTSLNSQGESLGFTLKRRNT